MRLVRLGSNKESFREVKFNEQGPSFIIARQSNKESSEKGDTYNGVGKSLMIKIIHFCLGAGTGTASYKKFCSKLPGWEFYLEFRDNNNLYTSIRSTGTPNKIVLKTSSLENELLDCSELNYKVFNKKMGEIIFGLDNEERIRGITFRNLINFFIRVDKEAYSKYYKPGYYHTPYDTMINNSMLLGLDVRLAEKNLI